jgi:hypothetical protein
MKRLGPLLLAAIAALLIGGGLVWKIVQADACMGKGRVVTASMSRSQACSKP